MEAELTRAVSERMVELVAPRLGARVLDLATGIGEPALHFARVVGPSGSVLGVDVSSGAIATARERAREFPWCRFEVRDVHDEQLWDSTYDVVTCRWALTSFPDPEAVLARIARCTPRLVLATWAEPERVPWWSIPRRVTERYVALSPIDPSRAGTMRWSAKGLLETKLADAGFQIEHQETMTVDVVTEHVGDWARSVFSAWRAAVPAERLNEWDAELGRHPRLGGETTLTILNSLNIER